MLKPLKITASLVAVCLLASACSKSLETQAVTTTSASDPTITLADGKYTVDAPIMTFGNYILIETQMGSVTPRVVSMDRAIADLASYDVIFMGEAHGHVASHRAQVDVFAGLYGLSEDKKLALSMEQFERSQQHIVDQYLAGEIGEQMLRDEGKAWDHYRSSYRPTVEFAKRRGLPVIAAEVPAGMVSCVGEEGPSFLDRLEGAERTWIADKLDTFDGAYKDRYLQFLKYAAGHGVSDPNVSAEEKAEKEFKSYAAQVSRDSTMAMSMAEFLKNNPGTQIMHTNGSFHSAALLGTPERLAMRIEGLKMANVHTILVKDPDNPQFEAKDVGEGQYLLLVHPTPRNFVKMANINAFIKRTRGSIEESRCKY